MLESIRASPFFKNSIINLIIKYIYSIHSFSPLSSFPSLGEDKNVESIFLIEKIFGAKASGEQNFYGNAFYKPEETFHVPTRKFLEKEVFRTDVHATLPFSKIAGRCVVVPVRDYFR